MHSQKRRLRRRAAELDITAFMNLIVVLVPFLLSSVVFSRLAVLDLNLPAAASGPTEVKRDLQLEITIRSDALEVGDRNIGLIQRIHNSSGGYDFAALSDLMQQLKTKFPDKAEATILLEPDTAYDTLVQVMDAVRVGKVEAGGVTHSRELFPEISIGDAPRAVETKSGKKS